MALSPDQEEWLAGWREMLREAVAPAPPNPTEERARLRDFFAAAALQGLLANSSLDTPPPSEAAADAYLYADAMLRRREAPPEPHA